MEYIRCFSSPLGFLTASSDGQALTALFFSDCREGPDDDLPLFSALDSWLQRYFAGGDPGPVPVPLAPRGTEFQKQVFSALMRIPYGETLTYGELARQLSSSPRAIGAAVGRNPIALAIPCHRVLGTGGRLTGYAWGLSRKQALLALEQQGSTKLSAAAGIKKQDL